jgi:hypothetical protein
MSAMQAYQSSHLSAAKRPNVGKKIRFFFFFGGEGKGFPSPHSLRKKKERIMCRKETGGPKEARAR